MIIIWLVHATIYPYDILPGTRGSMSWTTEWLKFDNTYYQYATSLLQTSSYIRSNKIAAQSVSYKTLITNVS
jgi:hypothetical protein